MKDERPESKMVGALRNLSHALKQTVPLADRLDSWINPVTLQGTRDDKTTYGHHLPNRWLQDYELSTLYHHDDMAARMIDIVPQEMLRKGFSIDLGDPDATAAIDKRFGEIDVVGAFKDGLRWGRCYGGGGVLIGCDDGQDTVQPLDATKADDIDFLLALDRRLMWPFRRYSDRSKPNFGKVETYLLTSGEPGADIVEVHESRVIVFPGATTGIREKQILNSWDASVLQRAYDTLRQFNTGWKAVEVMMTDGNQSIFKMGSLSEILRAPGGGAEVLKKRIQAMDLYRSVLRAIVLDADAEESFERQSVSFEQIPQTLDKFMLRLSATVEIPVTILMGQSPAGMNATGDSDFRWFYDRIDSHRTEIMNPRLTRVSKTWLQTRAGQDATKLNPDKTRILPKYPALWTDTPSVQATRRKALIDGDDVLIKENVITSAEVGLQRLRPDGYEHDLILDPAGRAAREALLSTELETMANAGQVDDDEVDEATTPKAAIAPADLAVIITVNEAREAAGFPDLPGPDGKLTILEYKAKNATEIAEVAQATAGNDPNEPEPEEPAPQIPFGGVPSIATLPGSPAIAGGGTPPTDVQQQPPVPQGQSQPPQDHADACEARLFTLHRDIDESGVSGTGEIADGVAFGDGHVTVRWRTKTASTTNFGSISDMRAVHGHAGKTRIVWADETRTDARPKTPEHKAAVALKHVAFAKMAVALLATKVAKANPKNASAQATAHAALSDAAKAHGAAKDAYQKITNNAAPGSVDKVIGEASVADHAHQEGVLAKEADASAGDAEWNEDNHPRDEAGRFS